MAKSNLETYTDDIIKEINTFFADNYPATITFKKGRKKDVNGSPLYGAMLKQHWYYLEEERKKAILGNLLMGGKDVEKA